MMPHFQKPFQWANRNTVKTNTIGAMAAFWGSFSVLGGNQLVAEKVGKEFVPYTLLVFFGTGVVMTIAAGLIARMASKKKIIFIGLAVMAAGTVAMPFVHTFGSFVLTKMLLGVGFFPVISTTANIYWEFLPNDPASQRRGRNFSGSLNYMMSAFASSAIILITVGKVGIWFGISVIIIVIAALVLWSIKDPVVDEVQTWKNIDKSKPPFFQKLIDVATLRVTWPYSLLVLCAMVTNMWLVFYIGVWAAFVIFCGEAANALSGPLVVRLAERADKKDPLQKNRGDRIVSLGALVALFISMGLIMTGNLILCITGSMLLGVAQRAGGFSFSQLGSDQAKQPGKGAYTFFSIIVVGQFSASVYGQVFGYGAWLYFWTLPVILGAIILFTRDLNARKWVTG
jgi:MFS family permease